MKSSPSPRPGRIAAAALIVLATSAGATGATTKDIVLDRMLVPVAVNAASASAAVGDAMVVSVLIESPDGTLSPKSTQTLFHTGDRFRVKLMASREGKVSLYNTNPRGETDAKPMWQGELKLGLETISPRLALTGTSGLDQLHVVLEPSQPPDGPWAWLGRWLRSSKDEASKDIRLDVENTASTTYLLNSAGQGIVTTVRIAHSGR
jgi:hypothetical protein